MRKLILLLGVSLVLLSCDPTSIAVFQTGSSIKSAIIGNSPPDKARNIKDLTALNGYDLTSLSVSPGGVYAVMSFFKNSGPQPWPTRLEIYSSVPGKQLKKFSSNDLKNMIEQSTNLHYPSKVKVFVTFDIRWLDGNTVIFEVQPLPDFTGSDSTPSHVSIVYNIHKNEVDQVRFYDRGQPSPIIVPTHTEKTTYTLRINSGKLYIEGKEVMNMPASIKKADLSIFIE